MAKKLNPAEIEAARKRSSRTERREQKRQLLHEEIEQNQSSGGVVVIPPPQKHYAEGVSAPKLRVAAYCRVSTQEELQVGSFEMQIHHFRQKIESTPNWELV